MTCRLLTTFLTPFTCDATIPARAFSAAVSTSPVRYTPPLLVSTHTRVRVLSRSPASEVFTDVVRVLSSIFCPVVSPVIAWQPVMKKRTTKITANILTDHKYLLISFQISVFLMTRRDNELIEDRS